MPFISSDRNLGGDWWDVKTTVHSERFGDNTARELAQTQSRLKLLKSLVHRINSGMEVKQVFERTLQEAHKTFPELRVAYGVISDDGALNVERCFSPPTMPEVSAYRVENKFAGDLIDRLRHGEEVMVRDVAREPRIKSGVRSEDGKRTRSGARSLLMVPIPHPDSTMSVLIFAAPEAHDWSGFERATLNDMAEFLTISLREAHAERQRLAVEKHLRQMQKMEALGQLVGGVAHDFNNLMTAIQMYSGLLEKSELPAELNSYAEEITRAGERGAALVKQLLTLARQQVLDQRPIDLNAVLREMLDMTGRLIGAQIVLKLECDPGLRLCRLDCGQIQQVVLNLVINARDAMPGGGSIFISTANKRVPMSPHAPAEGPPPGDYVILAVKDSGEGMDSWTQAHIFEPFFTTKPRGEGTGLGLSTVFGIVKQHGGYVFVQSAPGKGTTFTMYFPCVTAEERSARASDAVYAPGPALKESTVVLLVEDNDIVRTSIRRTLTMHGFAVLEAPRPESALRLLKDHGGDVHIMLTDLVMPGMTGRQLAERVQATHPQLPVLFMSGYSDDPRTRELTGEKVEFLQKPFPPGTLVRRLREVLGQARNSPETDLAPTTRKSKGELQ